MTEKRGSQKAASSIIRRMQQGTQPSILLLTTNDHEPRPPHMRKKTASMLGWSENNRQVWESQTTL